MKKLYISIITRLARRLARKMTVEDADLFTIELRTAMRREAVNAAAAKAQRSKARYARARYTVIHGRRAM